MNFHFYRVFRWDRHSQGASPGGPLHVPRSRQASGRHDIPERDGVIYGSITPVSSAAEAIKSFRGQPLLPLAFGRPEDGTVLALAHLVCQKPRLIDLDDPKELDKRGLAPSHVASPRREDTQDIARRLFDEGLAGFLWWSALNSTWKNVTLFESRVKRQLKIEGRPVALTVKHPDVLEAAKQLSIEIEKQK